MLSNVFRRRNLFQHLSGIKSFQNQQEQYSSKVNQAINKSNNQNLDKSFYKLPSFYKYFNQFLIDNNFHKLIPEELKFKYKQTLEEFEEVYDIISDNSNQSDDEFTSLAKSESNVLINSLINFQDSMISYSCLDDREINECTFEIKSGVGGKEASLFAEELYSLYLKFITIMGWDIKFNKEDHGQVEFNENTSLLTKTIEVDGIGCYYLLRHEAGVHRVQRVPKTERYGRIHTSTVSISVIPVRNNLVTIKDSDLKFEVKNSSGAGGQNVNRNLTCVRCIHVPTGHAVESQETRFQYLNKEIAIRKIKTLLNQIEFDRLEKEAKQQRRAQIGISARSDKIRTYNFPQNRITDHRLTGPDSNLYNLVGYMNGEECDKMKNVILKLEDIRHNELKRQLRILFERQFEKKLNCEK